MNAAQLSRSPRLQRVLAVLREAGPAGLTTREIVQRASVMAVSACVAELRENGCFINCTHEGEGPDGSAIYRYVLLVGPDEADATEPVSVKAALGVADPEDELPKLSREECLRRMRESVR